MNFEASTNLSRMAEECKNDVTWKSEVGHEKALG